MVAGTDTEHYKHLTKDIYRLLPIRMTVGRMRTNDVGLLAIVSHDAGFTAVDSRGTLRAFTATMSGYPLKNSNGC